jgi:hypothetical protein
MGCFDLALLVAAGRRVTADPAQAATLYQHACELGNAGACNNLGTAYLRGVGVTADRERALTLYRRACDAGERIACDNVRELTQQTPGTPSTPTTPAWSANIGSSTVNGTSFNEVHTTCGPLEILGLLSTLSAEVRRCGRRGEARVTFTLQGGQVTEVRALSAGDGGRYLERAIRPLRFGPMSCAVELGVGH